jgi:membrane protein DedA with SNARE-associated domain
MISEITNWIMEAMRAYGPLTVFIGVIIESVIVPIPSPLIIMGAGAILIEPGLSAGGALGPILSKIVLPGSVASTLGAYFAYGIAYWGGKPMIDRFARFLGFGWGDVQQMERRIEGRVNLMVFLLRALPIVPLSLISAAAGVLRLPATQFGLWTFLGSIPRCLLLGYLGFLARDTYLGLAQSINRMESVVSGLLVVGAFAVILWLRARMKT